EQASFMPGREPTAEPWPGGVPGGNKADRGHGGPARRGTYPMRRRPRCAAVSAWEPFPQGHPPVAAAHEPASPAGRRAAGGEVGATRARMGLVRPRAARATTGAEAPGSVLVLELLELGLVVGLLVRLPAGEEAPLEQVHERRIHGLHADGTPGLHRGLELVQSPLPDEVRNGGGV